MHYSFEIDVTASDTEAAPVIFPVLLSAGIVTDVSFLFDVGDGFSSCVCLWNRGRQLLPTNVEGFYSADGMMISAKTWYDLSKEDNQLYVLAWNRGGLYDHTVTCLIEVREIGEPDIHQLAKQQNEIIGRLVELMRSLF